MIYHRPLLLAAQLLSELLAGDSSHTKLSRWACSRLAVWTPTGSFRLPHTDGRHCTPKLSVALRELLPGLRRALADVERRLNCRSALPTSANPSCIQPPLTKPDEDDDSISKYFYFALTPEEATGISAREL